MRLDGGYLTSCESCTSVVPIVRVTLMQCSGLMAIQPGHTLVTSGVYRVIRQWVLGIEAASEIVFFPHERGEGT